MTLNFEILAVISIMFTAVMQLVLEMIDSKREKEEKNLEDVKSKWKEEHLV